MRVRTLLDSRRRALASTSASLHLARACAFALSLSLSLSNTIGERSPRVLHDKIQSARLVVVIIIIVQSVEGVVERG